MCCIILQMCYYNSIETAQRRENNVTDLINQLNKISKSSNERAQGNIADLIGRIEWFLKCGDEEKLGMCLAEANLWGAKQ